MASVNATGGVTIGNMMPGLVSGLDTESMVEKLLSGTQSKIDKQNAEKQQVTWKQEIYRNIITKLDNFRTKYFSYNGSTNILSSSFYNTMTSVSSSGAVKVISSSSKAAPNITIDAVTQLATAYQAKSVNTVSKPLEGQEIDSTKFTPGETYSIDVTLDGVTKTIKFEAAADTADPAKADMGATVNNLNESIKNVWGDSVRFQYDSTGRKLSATTKATVSTNSDGTTTQNYTHKLLLGNTSGTTTLTDLGITDGASNKLDYNALLSEDSLSTKLTGDRFVFEINGVEIKANKNDTIGDVINRINGSEAGVKVSYSSIEDKFTVTSKVTGAISGIEMKQTEGNLLTALFGVGSGSGAASDISYLKGSSELTGEAVGTSESDLLDAIIDATNQNGGQSLKLHVNGRAVEVSIPKPGDGDAPYDQTTFLDAVNKQLEEYFGTNADGDANIRLERNSVTLPDGTQGTQVTIHTEGGFQVSLDQTDTEHNLNDALGLTEVKDQKVHGDTLLSDIGLSGTLNVGGSLLTIQPGWKMDDLIREFNNLGKGQLAFDDATGILSVSGVPGTDAVIGGQDADGKEAMKKLFGQESLTFNQTGVAMTVTDPGRNAQFMVNGVSVERNSNEFEVDGVTIQLTDLSSDPIRLTSDRDTNKIVDGLKEFVEEYNGLVDELSGYLQEEPKFRSYAPLTDAQKKEMTEREIELWEEKAKQGLLRNDSTIEGMLSQLRMVTYQKVDSAGLALYDIGIEAMADYKENGKLVIDEDKLRAALGTNPDKVQQLFTDSGQGIGTMFSTILKENANVSSASPGLLVRYAGAKNTALNTENTLSHQLKDISDRIKQLNAKYENERARYWKQFSSMEQALSQLNSQSSWISQQFSSN